MLISRSLAERVSLASWEISAGLGCRPRSATNLSMAASTSARRLEYFSWSSSETPLIWKPSTIPFGFSNHFNLVTQAPAFPGQLVLVDLAAVADGFEDVVGLQGQPALAASIPGGIGNHEMGVELWIEFPRGIVAEGCCTDVACGFRVFAPSLTGLNRSEPFQFRQGSPAGPVVSVIEPVGLPSSRP